MKIRRMVSFTTAILLVTLATVFFAARAGAVAIYEPPQVKTVRAYYVNDLGRISGQFTPGTLQKGDCAYLRFPDGFIWTTAHINAEQAKAAAACQSTEEWNTMEVTPDNAIYGTSNYIRVPAQISGAANGLYKGTTPVLHFTRQKDNEVLMEIVEDLDPGLECFLDINATRVYVDRGHGAYVSLTIDAPGDSGFATDPSLYNRVECLEAPRVYTGIPAQKIGTVVINEAEAGRFQEGQVLNLELPAGAKWVKLAADSSHYVTVSGSISDDGRMAQFRFSGESSSPASLTLRDMEVFIEPELTGILKVKASGSAGLVGDLDVADVASPAAIFTVGDKSFVVDGAKKSMDVAPYIKEDRVYLPLRYFAEALGIGDDQIIWNQDQRCVEINRNGKVVKLTIDSDMLYVDNTAVQMDAAPEIIAPGRTMLPLRWVAEALDCDVYWDEDAGQVKVLS